MLTITNEDIFIILDNIEDCEISFPKPFNLIVDTEKGTSLISVSGIAINPYNTNTCSFIGQYYPTWGKYYNTDAEDEILNYTIDDVYPNKEDAQEMIQYLKSLL